MRLDQPFTPQFLYELAKMDGAIIVNPTLTKIAYANVQLMPDPTIPSTRPGTRHPHGERVAKQTGALVISISQQRSTISVYVGQARYQLDPCRVLAKTNQALATLETYRAAARPGADAADRARVPERVDARRRPRRAAARGDDDADGGGDRARLRRARRGGAADPHAAARARRRRAARAAVASCYDYHADGAGPRAELALEGLHALPYRQLLEPERLAELLGYPRTSIRSTTRSRRAATGSCRTSRACPEPVVKKVVADLGDLEAIIRASQRDLEAISGVGDGARREIREGPAPPQEHNLVDRLSAALRHAQTARSRRSRSSGCSGGLGRVPARDPASRPGASDGQLGSPALRRRRSLPAMLAAGRLPTCSVPGSCRSARPLRGATAPSGTGRVPAGALRVLGRGVGTGSARRRHQRARRRRSRRCTRSA
jgi:diadenylate cyclase